MAYQCKKCNVPAFHTVEKLKNHSRIHSTQCMVKFPVEGYVEPFESFIPRDPITQHFVCTRCLSYKTYTAARLQQHCKTCKGENLDPSVLQLAIHPLGHPPIPENNKESYISELGYFVNEKLHIVICCDCLQWVHVGAILSHASRYHASRFHQHKKIDPERLAMDIQYFQLDQGMDELNRYLEAIDVLKDPIEGLPVEDGYMCTLCTFYSSKLNTFKAHVSNHHKEGNYSIEDCSKRCFVQRLTLCPSLCPQGNSWFGVTAPLCTPPEDGPNNLLLDIITKEAIAREEEILAAPYKDLRQLPMFIKVLHWDVLIENMNIDVVDMAPLLTAHQPGDVRFFPDHLQGVCMSLMMDFQSILPNTETLLRRKVRSTNPINISRNPFSRLQQSCQDYAKELVHLLLILLRALDSKNMEEKANDILWMLVPLEEKVQRSLQRLWNGLQIVGEGGQFTSDQLEESKLHCIEVLEALFFITRSSHAIPEASLLVLRFVIFAAIQQHRVLTPDDITHRISRMMYWCRSLVLYKIVHYSLNPGDDVSKVEGEFLLYVREDQRTPFAAILEVKRLVRAVTKNETALPKVIWVGDVQIVDGIHVDIAHVSKLVCCSIQELYKELEDDLLLGMPEYNLNRDRILYNKSGGLLDDNLSDYRNGQWFINNKNNLCSRYTLSLILHIARTTSLHSRFINSVQVEGTPEIIWKKDALSKWIGKVGKWLQKLMSIIHLIAGQPARGVELLACSTRNTPAQIRGVYFVNGLVMLLTLYGKGDNLRGSQVPIARFLCKDTSFLLINYLTYVREMEIIASKVLYGLPETAVYNRLLAVKEGQPMSSRDLSNGIASIFLKHQPRVNVTLAPWRHMAIAWMHRFLKYTDVLELTGNGVVDSQAGHSQQVASKCYARSNFDHPSIGRDELQLYRWVSVEWHRILGLHTDEVLLNLNAIMPIVRHQSSTPITYESGQESGVGFGPRQSQLSTTTTTNIHHHHHHHQIKVVRCQGDIGIDYLSFTCSKQAMLGLVALGHTKFKSSHQAKAIHRILERQEDLLVVLPTGGGKTLLFLLPAVVERGRYTTVVICPFVALRTEMERRAQEANISMQVYSESTSPGGVDILLVSVEHCMLPTFQSHLAYLHAQNRLGRIVLDECHVALVDNSWRPILHNIRYVRKAPVPLLLLSATVPPHLEYPMKKFFNSQFSIIRSPTTRPNLIYEVRKVHGELGASLLAVLSSGPTTPKSIIFSRGKAETKEMAEMLCSHGLSAVHYHADLDMEARNTAHNAWTRGKADIMVATGAFGTGVDLGAVRLVVHLNEPYSMIHLAQESGRGGRDGSPSKHIILLSRFRQMQTEKCTKMVEYLGGMKCRRWVLQEYIDGEGLDCFSSGSERCDVCEFLLGHIESSLTTTNQVESSTSESNESFHKSQYIDLFSSPDDGGTPGMPEDHDPPTKRICVGDALMFGSAKGTQESHADLLLMTLTLVQYLAGVKDKCIVCTMGEHEVPDYKHELCQCPYLKGLCLKCFGNDGHRAKECRNKLQFKGLGCYGCGLPKKLGSQVMHPEPFEGGCKSMGNDKLIPACWYMWRHAGRFHKLFIESGCPPNLEDPQFAGWLAGAHENYRTNVLALFVSYVRNERQFLE